VDPAVGPKRPNEDWRIPFVQRRHPALLQILCRRMGEDAVKQTLRELGTACSAMSDEVAKKHRGDLAAFARSIQESVSGDTVTYDPEKRIVIMSSPERTSCFCPFNGANAPELACHCSLGWQQHTWETFFERKVTVSLEESVLRGGKRCTFVIRVSDTPLDAGSPG
jgi:hypothetical protein